MSKSLKSEVTNSNLYASLYGLREIFRQEFKIDDIFFNLSEDKKSYLRRKEHTSYPYASIKLSNFKIPKDKINLKAMRFSGVVGHDQTQATIKQNFIFPFIVSGEFVYMNSSIQETLLFIEHFSLLAATDRFVYKISDKDKTWFCRAAVEDISIALAERQLSNNSDPGVFEISQPFELTSKAGFSRDVSKTQHEPSYNFVLD